MLDHDLGLEIQPRRKAQIFVRWPGVAINTAMLTPAVRIQAHLKSHVRAVVAGDDALRLVGQILRGWPIEGLEVILVVFDLLELELVVGRFKPVWRVESSTTAARRGCTRTIHVMTSP